MASQAPAYVIQLDGSAPDYLERIRAASAKRFKNYRRLEGKLDREVGPLSLRAPDFLALPNVACVGGSWLTPKDKLVAGDWAGIEQLAREAAALRAR